MRALTTVLLLIGSNCFMTWAWYGHLKKTGWTIPVAIAISWLIAFPEYLLQVPANRIGHISQGGPFTAAQLKVIQEAITLCVFVGFSILVLKERPRLNEYAAFVLIFAGVAVAMMGRSPRDGAPGEQVAPPAAQALASPASPSAPTPSASAASLD